MRPSAVRSKFLLRGCSLAALALAAAAGCGGSEAPTNQSETGGSSAHGGSAHGGSPASGGATPTANGGAQNGGTPSAGGSTEARGGAANGGALGAGGTSSTGVGGSNGKGGALSGGALGAGGKASGGTTSGSGGAAAGATSGGANANGGKQGSGGSGSASCTTPPPQDAVLGWASVNAMSQNGTTGGGNATPQTVTTLAAFTTAVAGNTAAVIYVNGALAAGKVNIGSNKTIVGLCGAEFHGHLGVSGSSNVIVRNLKIVGYGVGDCSKDPSFDASVGCSSGADAVTIQSNAHHVWFDHCDISDGTDGNLDITSGADYVTISWTKFHYTPRTDDVGNDSTGAAGHRFSNLIGSADDVPGDVGHLNITWHHDWWADNVNQRMPRSRHGQIHVVNNLFTATGNSYCTNSGYMTHLLVENNVYSGVKNPLSPDANGDMLARNNLFQSTSGTTTANGTGFTPPYSYTPEATASLAAAIQSGAGPH